MQISGIELRLLAVDLIGPFNTSYGSIVERTPIIVRVFGDGYEGWAECPADVAPSMHTDPVADAVLHALFAAEPRAHYLATPDQGQAGHVIRDVINDLVELNGGHRFSYSRDELVELLDERLAAD